MRVVRVRIEVETDQGGIEVMREDRFSFKPVDPNYLLDAAVAEAKSALVTRQEIDA